MTNKLMRFLISGTLFFSLNPVISQNPVVTVLAGSGGFLDSTLAEAQFRGPYHILFNRKKSEFYVADRSNFRIRVVREDKVTTLAGSGVLGATDGVGTAARLTGPSAMALNATSDTLYFADAAGNRDGRIRFVVLAGADSGKVVTIAGQNGGNPPTSNNPVGTSARFNGNILSLVRAGNHLYFLDGGSSANRLRRLTLSGTFPVQSLDSSGTFSNTLSQGFVLGESEGICKGRADSILFVSSKTANRVWKVNVETGAITSLAGTGVAGYANGDFLSAQFNNMSGLAFDSASNKLYLAEKGAGTGNVGIRVLDLGSNTVSLVSGAINASGAIDGPLATARFNNPQNLSFDANGNLLVADAANNRIRSVLFGPGEVTTFLGAPSNVLVSSNPFSVRFSNPQSAIVDAANNVWFADRGNHVIRMYNAVTKAVSIVAGKRGVSGNANGPALDSALFNQPYSMALKGDSLFISDGSGNAPNGIRILDLTTNRVSFYAPIRGQLLIHRNSLLVFGDVDGGSSSQNRIIRFNLSTGVRDTLAGTGQNGSSQGPGRQAQIFNPQRGAVRNDTLYFVTGRSSKPWRIRTLALNNPQFTVDTFLTRSQTEPLNNPGHLVIDGFGTMYIANNAFNGGIFRADVGTKSVRPSIPSSILPANITSIAFDTNRNALILTEASNSRLLRVAPVYSVANVAPSFTLARTRDTLFRTDNVLRSLSGTATNISANVSIFNTLQNQTVSFTAAIPNNQQVLFSQAPAVSPEGVLTYKLADNVPFTNSNNISVNVAIRARDNGGTENGGVDSSAAQTFTIVIRYQNLAPVFTVTQDTVTVASSVTTAQTLTNFLTGIASGSAQEPGQNLTFSVTNDNAALFTTAPALTGSNANRNLTFRPNGTLGLANIRVVLRDNGGVANGGQDSTVKNFVIRVTLINSVSGLQTDPSIRMFPNPASSEISVRGIQTGDLVEFMDAQGRVRKSQSSTQGEAFELNSFPHGLYFLRVVRNGKPVFSGSFRKN